MPLRILIADDSATNRLLFSTVMTRLGYLADTAASGREAVMMFRETRYDVVFLDLNMPGMDGFHTAAEIRRNNPRNIPVYAISGYVPQEMETKFNEAGIRRCIQKPLDREKIDSVLQECRLASGTTPVFSSAVPSKLLSTYAQELRSRGAACLRFLEDKNIMALAREAHTIRALGEMLKTPEVESTAARLESACRLRKFGGEAEETHAACLKTAALIEASAVRLSSTT